MNSTSIKNVRPEVLHSVKFGDETKVGLPRFAFVILEKPKSPPVKNKQTSYYRVRPHTVYICQVGSEEKLLPPQTYYITTAKFI